MDRDIYTTEGFTRFISVGHSLWQEQKTTWTTDDYILVKKIRAPA